MRRSNFLVVMLLATLSAILPLNVTAQGWFNFGSMNRERHDVKASVKLVPERAMTGQPCRFVFEVEVPKSVTVEGVNVGGLPNPDEGVEYGEALENLADVVGTNANRVVKRFALPARFLKAQKFELTSLSVQGMLTTRKQTGSMSFSSSSNFAKRLNPLTVEVEDLPTDGKPLNFSGAIGSSFKIKQTVKPNRVHPGDLLTVTYRLDFEGYCPTNFFPNIEAYSKDFRTYEPKQISRTENSIEWTQLIVPQTVNATNTSLASVHYYNLQTKRYEAAFAYPQKLVFISDKEATKQNAAVVIDAGDKPSEEPTSATATSSQPLVLYFAPKETSPIIAKLPPNTKYKILSRSGTWTRIQTETVIGWLP